MTRPGEVDKHGFDESKLGTRTDDTLVVLMYIVSVVSYFSHLIKIGLGLFFELLGAILAWEAITIKATYVSLQVFTGSLVAAVIVDKNLQFNQIHTRVSKANNTHTSVIFCNI